MDRSGALFGLYVSYCFFSFMNHEGGAPLYDTLMCLDMFGICLVNTLGALPIIHITFLCYPSFHRLAMLVYLLLSVHGVYCSVIAQSNVHCLQSFAWRAMFCFILFMLCLTGSDRGSSTSLCLYLTIDTLVLLGGLVNISHLPERFSPGWFDYWFNCHQNCHHDHPVHLHSATYVKFEMYISIKYYLNLTSWT
ncbi:progestin and adipoQ receptor family member 4 [Carassius auratus]|uniref:Progestin and adipoQ receptor family member 4 n=1 Tax=Carassius auratus TaxID=7957 RepID=A0A6P6QIT0_CARAU|nr:progestin and adipoQ receptor family member 4-like [Carassius auratus]